MTGAGTGETLIGRESSYGGSVVDTNNNGDPDLFDPGRNPEVTELELDRQLDRLRDTQSAESVESIAQNVEGAISISAAISGDTHANIEEIVFNSGPGTSFTPGRANSAKVYVEVDYLSGTATRELDGAIPIEYSIDFTQGETVTYELRMLYGDETKNVTINTNDVTRASDDTTATFHSYDLSINAVSVPKLQSATLSISDIAQFHRGTGTSPTDAAIANPTTTLEVTDIQQDATKIDLAYGNSAGTTTLDDAMDDVAATITIDDITGSAISTYEMSSVKPTTYSWENMLAADDTTQNYSLHVNDGVTVT